MVISTAPSPFIDQETKLYELERLIATDHGRLVTILGAGGVIPPHKSFAPMVREVFDRKPYDPSVIRPGEREPLVVPERAAERAA